MKGSAVRIRASASVFKAFLGPRRSQEGLALRQVLAPSSAVESAFVRADFFVDLDYAQFSRASGY
jgi:hypothetical protein